MFATLDEATAAYWAAENHAQQHWAYVCMLRLGAEPAYGETPEHAERIKNCPDCPAWEQDVPLHRRGFGV
jgi:hypothetical protein